MQRSPKTLFREDTLLGVCQALGEDFGFNPLWLRVAFGVSLLANPTIVIGTYLGLGVVIALSRLLFPNPRRRPAEARSEAVVAETAVAEAEPEELAVAA
jgi:phage shock protein PspC (stress-responsive transcriptional regulator)